MHPAGKQQSAFALGRSPRRSIPAEELGLADLVNRRIGVLHDGELVTDDPAVGQPLGDALLERLPHVDTGVLHSSALKGTQSLGEGPIERLVLALGAEPERLADAQIAHHGDELLLLAQKDPAHSHLP